MTTWRLSTTEKTSAIEIETWTKDNLILTLETIWDSGSALIESNDKPVIDLTNEEGIDVYVVEYPLEIEELSEGETQLVYPDEISVEEENRLNDLIEAADDTDVLESEGWELEDHELYFHGALKLEAVA